MDAPTADDLARAPRRCQLAFEPRAFIRPERPHLQRCRHGLPAVPMPRLVSRAVPPARSAPARIVRLPPPLLWGPYRALGQDSASATARIPWTVLPWRDTVPNRQDSGGRGAPTRSLTALSTPSPPARTS